MTNNTIFTIGGYVVYLNEKDECFEFGFAELEEFSPEKYFDSVLKAYATKKIFLKERENIYKKFLEKIGEEDSPSPSTIFNSEIDIEDLRKLYVQLLRKEKGENNG